MALKEYNGVHIRIYTYNKRNIAAIVRSVWDVESKSDEKRFVSKSSG